jgi:Cu/Ag efflux protein CusF
MKHSFMVMATSALLGIVGTTAQAQQAAGGVQVETSPGQAKAVQVREVVATVDSIDLAKREVTLRDSKGKQHPVVAGPDVRNLEQVKVGDRVVVQYLEALSLKLVKDGKEVPGSKATSDSARAPAGARPGGIVAEQVQVTADVIAVNTETRMVTLRGPKQVVDLQVNDPAQLALIKVGDQIDAVYTQALALSVQPAPAGK